MDIRQNYQALYQLDESAEQMRSAMEVLSEVEGLSKDIFKSYQNDLESIRTQISERAMDRLKSLEHQHIVTAFHRKRDFQQKLRQTE